MTQKLTCRIGELTLTANRLKIARMQLGWSQRELARRSGISYPTISRAESGREPSLSAAIQMAKTLQYSVEDLWDVERRVKQ